MSRSKFIRSAGILGLALFALFFGAGNLIFPPAIGLEGGQAWPVGYIAYFLADVGLAMLGLAAMIRTDGKVEGVTGVIGKVPSLILNCAMILCVGPLLAIPRTAATSFEMGSDALAPALAGDPLARAVFSIAFFAIVFFAVRHPGNVVGGIGKTLTPLLVIALAVLIVAGFANPAAPAAEPRVDHLLQEGVLNGYQTMDLIAALAFSLVVVSSIGKASQENGASRAKIAFVSCFIAAGLLFAVYGGLAYLGATTGQLWGDGYMAGAVNQAGLLSYIAGAVLGSTGATVLAAVVLLACLTTAIGLVSACSEFFVSLSGGKAPYLYVAGGICAFSAIACNLGLSQIVAVSAPVLSLVYPTVTFLVAMRLLPLDDQRAKLPARLGAAVSFSVSLCLLFADTFGIGAFSFAHLLPLDGFGFGWLVPTAAAALAGYAISRMRTRRGGVGRLEDGAGVSALDSDREPAEKP